MIKTRLERLARRAPRQNYSFVVGHELDDGAVMVNGKTMTHDDFGNLPAQHHILITRREALHDDNT